MKIVFIADAHLKGLDDPSQGTLVRFLDGLTGVDTLVILGDFFEFWTGSNRVAMREYRPALESLKRVKERDTAIIYLEGNHDFSMGRFFTDTLTAEVRADSYEVMVGRKRFFLAHGDIVSMKFGYMVWRSFLRSRLFRIIAAAATPELVWKVAFKLSNRSRRYSGNADIDSVLRVYARELIGSGIDTVVLAHSHVPGVYKEKAGGRTGIYANPGSWAGDKSYLVYNDGAFKLENFKG